MEHLYYHFMQDLELEVFLHREGGYSLAGIQMAGYMASFSCALGPEGPNAVNLVVDGRERKIGRMALVDGGLVFESMEPPKNFKAVLSTTVLPIGQEGFSRPQSDLRSLCS